MFPSFSYENIIIYMYDLGIGVAPLSITLVLQLFQKGSTAYSIIAMGPALSAADH